MTRRHRRHHGAVQRRWGRDHVVRPAAAGDLDTVIGLLAGPTAWARQRGVAQWPARFPRAVLQAAVERGELYVVEAGGEIRGTITLALSDPEFWGDRDDAAFVHRLAIRRSARGLGRELVAWADEAAAAAGRRYLCLDCISTSVRLRRYYEDLGFRCVGERSGPASHPHTAAHGPWRAALYERPVGARGVPGSGERPGPEQLRGEARHVFGEDPRNYALGRPDYPERVYDVLAERCGLGPGRSVLELGPGTGLVTRRLVASGGRVVAVEPDRRLAAYLRAQPFCHEVGIVESTFEEAEVPSASFDLAVAATSFHWVDQHLGLPKLAAALRPGGWAALWWTVFGDPEARDAFADAARARLGEDLASQRGAADYQLDVGGRRRDLRELGGFLEVEAELIRWTARLETDRLLALLDSQIAIRRRPAAERRRLLGELRALAEDEFGGSVDRPFVTVMYTGRR